MIETEKPRAKTDMKCPLWKKPMRQVCHECEWWTHLRGKHPQGEEILDHWGCAIAWLPILMIENSQKQAQTGAAVDKFADVVHKATDETIALRAELIGSMVRSITNNRPPPVEQITDASHNRSP